MQKHPVFNLAISQIVVENPDTAPIFEKFDISTSSKETLSAVCQKNSLCPLSMHRELSSVTNTASKEK